MKTQIAEDLLRADPAQKRNRVSEVLLHPFHKAKNINTVLGKTTREAA